MHAQHYKHISARENCLWSFLHLNNLDGWSVDESVMKLLRAVSPLEVELGILQFNVNLPRVLSRIIIIIMDAHELNVNCIQNSTNALPFRTDIMDSYLSSYRN